MERHGKSLGDVGHATKIDGDLRRPAPAETTHHPGTRGHCCALDRDRGCEVNNHLIRRAGAAFDPHVASQWQRDIESAGCAMSLSREGALRHWGAGSDAYVINVLFVLASAGVEIVSGRIRHIASCVIRNNRDVVAYLILTRPAFQRIKGITHSYVRRPRNAAVGARSEEHTSELQSPMYLV